MIFGRKKAISYVEIILVLTIVGVISAISVPSMKRHSQKTELGGLAQKAFLTMNQVVDSAILVNGPTRNWANDSSESFFAVLIPFFNVLNSSKTSVVTKDKMRYYIDDKEKADYTTVNVDVNGDNGPNVDGKDRHSFKVFHNNGTIEPIGDTLQLAKDGWQFTDALWYK